jgi:hypothetical protein
VSRTNGGEDVINLADRHSLMQLRGNSQPACGICSLLEGKSDRVAAGDGGYERSPAKDMESVHPVFLGAMDGG